MEIDLLVTTHNVTDLFKIFNFGSNVKFPTEIKFSTSKFSNKSFTGSMSGQ